MLDHPGVDGLDDERGPPRLDPARRKLVLPREARGARHDEQRPGRERDGPLRAAEGHSERPLALERHAENGPAKEAAKDLAFVSSTFKKRDSTKKSYKDGG